VKKHVIAGGANATVLASSLLFGAPAPEAEAAYCPGAVAMGSYDIPIPFGVIVIDWCDWAPPVPGVDSHLHFEGGGFAPWGTGGGYTWRNSANVIVPPPPGHV